MANERQMAQEYGKAGINCLLLVNGGGAFALLTQVGTRPETDHYRPKDPRHGRGAPGGQIVLNPCRIPRIARMSAGRVPGLQMIRSHSGISPVARKR